MSTSPQSMRSGTPYRRGGPANTFACATCEFPIFGKPLFHVGLAFCCAGCVAGGPCTCSYDDRQTKPTYVHECLDVTAVGSRR